MRRSFEAILVDSFILPLLPRAVTSSKRYVRLSRERLNETPNE
jgi:hypothetical protein